MKHAIVMIMTITTTRSYAFLWRTLNYFTHLEHNQYLRRFEGMQRASTPSQPSVEGMSRLIEPSVNDKGLHTIRFSSLCYDAA